MLDLVLTGVTDVVVVWVGLPVRTLDHSAVFIDVVLELSIPPLVYRQEVYLKNFVNWELFREVVKGLNWNRIIIIFNEALLRVMRDKVPKQTIVARTGDKPWFVDRCVLAHRAKQRAYRVGRSRTQADWEGYRLARRRAQLVYEDVE